MRSLEWQHLPSPLDSILEAVLTVSPNKQYRGIVLPTTPATTGPVKTGIENKYKHYRML